MSEVLVAFSEPVPGPDGITWAARACGAERENGLWEGWVEFIPDAGGDLVATGRETTQPNRADTLYWATGLTAVYLEGALRRALTPSVPHAPRTASIFNPFSAYRNGEGLLRRQLAALAPRHLVNIAVSHQLTDRPRAALEALSEPQLIELIVSAVRDRREELVSE